MSGAATGQSRPVQYLLAAVPFVLLACVALGAYANAWPNALVHDDKLFAGSERFVELSNIPRYFKETVWASAGGEDGLYRPLLLTSITLDARVWGDWAAGYHLVNIVLHVLVTILLYGLLVQLQHLTAGRTASDSRFALLAALLFAVHPVNTEVVNSIFNRSEMLVALGGLAGLLWFLRHMNPSPAKAWTGLGFVYFLTLFCKESAVVLPGLAILFVLSLSPNPWRTRIRKSLPALWLLAPLVLYFAIRAQALTPVQSSGAIEAVESLKVPGASGGLAGFGLPDWDRLMEVAGFAYECLKVYVWPVALRVAYEQISRPSQVIGLALHPVLILTAMYLSRQKRHGMLIGLVFFYLALLPASRIIGDPDMGPMVAERFLYFPSVGLMIIVAFGLRWLGLRFGFAPAAITILVVLGLLAPVTWARNAVWSSDIELFESEYKNGNRVSRAMVSLTSAHLHQSNFQRVAEICDENADLQMESSSFILHCATAYGRVGRPEEAEQAYLKATEAKTFVRAVAHANLARYYLRQDRWIEAKLHFEQAAEAEVLPANRAFRLGHMLVRLYPDDRAKLLEAKQQFEYALELQPAFAPARHWLLRVERTLELMERGGPGRFE